MDMGALKDVRHAAREAGRRLNWKITTRLAGGRLFVLDEQEVPEEIAATAISLYRSQGNSSGGGSPRYIVRRRR